MSDHHQDPERRDRAVIGDPWTRHDHERRSLRDLAEADAIRDDDVDDVPGPYQWVTDPAATTPDHGTPAGPGADPHDTFRLAPTPSGGGLDPSTRDRLVALLRRDELTGIGFSAFVDAAVDAYEHGTWQPDLTGRDVVDDAAPGDAADGDIPDHYPVGFDGPRALDCRRCGQRWPCTLATEAAKVTASKARRAGRPA